MAEEKQKIISGEGWEGLTHLDEKLVDAHFPLERKSKGLEGFYRRSSNLGLELVSSEEERGYVFVGELQVDRDIERRYNNAKRHYESCGRIIQRAFMDLRPEWRIAGFEWKSTL